MKLALSFSLLNMSIFTLAPHTLFSEHHNYLILILYHQNHLKATFLQTF